MLTNITWITSIFTFWISALASHAKLTKCIHDGSGGILTCEFKPGDHFHEI